MEKDNIANYVLASSPGKVTLPAPLQHFYASFKDKTPGEYTMGFGAGIDEMPFGPVTITVDNTRVSVVNTGAYESAIDKELTLISLQGYAQLTVFDRFYASCILVGNYVPKKTDSIVELVDHLNKTKEEREKYELKKFDEVKLHPSFYTEIYNDPINRAASTCGIYIVSDRSQQILSCDTVFQAIGVADFADSTVFGLAVAISVDVNTFTNAMNFSVAGSLRFADSNRYTIAGEIGMLNGKLNAIGFALRAKIPVATEVYLSQARISVRGFQEPRISVGFGGGMIFGPEMKIPDGLGVVKKALFPNLSTFHPLEISLDCDINPMRNYVNLTGTGVFMGSISVSASLILDNGDIDAELKAGTVRNNYLNGSLTVDYHKRKDNWNLHGNFNCSIEVDFLSFVGVMVSGGVDLLYNSQDYTVANTLYNRKDLTITVSGMGKVKLFFSFNISVQKTWVFNLSNTQLSQTEVLLKSISTGDVSELENIPEVMVCESEDIAENEIQQFRLSRDVIEAKSWLIDEQCSASGVVRFQVAAEYTLVDSQWRLTYTDGNTITVYTAENAAGVVSLQEFTHNYYELVLDTPDAGNWTLEILGDSRNNGGIYMDALKDEKIITGLEIVEQTGSVIKFRYSAYTGSKADTTLIRLHAEEISADSDDNPYSGIIAYLEETENGEFIWEIPEDFRHNAKYDFYISAASSDAATLSESNRVGTFIARQNADLECSWELAYSAGNSNTVTAYITITNTGAESTMCLWELLDYSNNDPVENGESYLVSTAPAAEVIASGTNLEIKGNSSVTLQQVITITDELRDNPSCLQLAVSQCNADGEKRNDPAETVESQADDTDEITFAAMNSMYCRKAEVSWAAVDGAVSYVLHYALDGNWDESGVYINDITGTSYTLSAAPGTYSCRIIAIGSDGNALGSWSEEKEVEILYTDVHKIPISGSSGSQEFTLNDGVYTLAVNNTRNFTGTLTLVRKDLVQTGEENNTVSLTQTETDILSLELVNGVLKTPATGILLDNGDYFWKWSRTGDDAGIDSEITVEFSGEIFPMEQQDRKIISIGDDKEMPLVNGVFVETLEGEVGFSNKDAIYQYMTDDGGELSLSIKSGTVFDTGLDLFIYVQNSTDGNFECLKTLTVAPGEYTADTVLLEQQVIKNNFYVQITAPDDSKGKYNTDYNFDLSFDAFEDSAQSADILKVNGETVSDWIGYRNGEHSYLLQIKTGDRYAVRLQGDAFDAILKVCEVNGTVIREMRLGADGTAYIDDIYLERGNYFVVVDSPDKGEGSYNTDYKLSAFELKTLYPEIDNSDDTVELAAQQESAALDTGIENWLGTGDSADYFKFSLAPAEANGYSLLLTLDETITQAVGNGMAEIICCSRSGEALVIDELSDGKWCVENPLAETEIYIGVTLVQPVADMAYSFTVSAEMIPVELTADVNGVSWKDIPGAKGYIVEYSTDNFATVIAVETIGNKVDFAALPAGSYQWRVKTLGGNIVRSGENIVSQYTAAEPLELVSNGDGNMDLFFANASGKWDYNHLAQHNGILDSWSGTGEKVALNGKNKLADIFEGSEDANILVMTDDTNGDALFVDDIYTALPGSVAEQQARIAKISEIRAGAGNDVVDMTSQRFEYTGDGVKIYGGSGNDTVWANNGSNMLFGDAGNDRLTGGAGDDVICGGTGNDSMHGGGGADTFCFGGNWGVDVIEQLEDGKVTLWFENGSESNWNALTLTYTDGMNSVKVSGISEENITLVFGDDDSPRYGELVSSGCFDDAASEKIFESKDKGMLA